MLRTWWRRWTGLTELEQRIDGLLHQCNELERASGAEIQRMIGDIGALERQLRALGVVPETIISDGPSRAPAEARLPSDDPLPAPQHRFFREAAAEFVDQPAKVRAVLDEWWRRHPRPKN